jgi:hypothetical protein
MNKQLKETIQDIVENKIIEKNIFSMSDDTLDELLSAVFNIDYEIMAEEELKKGDNISLDVAAKNVTSYDLNTISAIKNGQTRQFSTAIYLSYLVKENLIKEGEYIIQLNW